MNISNADFLWAPYALLSDGQWHANVLLEIGVDRHWKSVQARVSASQAEALHAQILPGPALPGVVNSHSHAFQRSFAGSTETRGDQDHAEDDFWSWRDRMYEAANRLTPEQVRDVAVGLYTELLRGGYTQVCEFHYLHHQPGGAAYADPYAMTWAICDAAATVGIGLTVLPVLYQRSGFAATGLRPDQSRFAGTPEWVRSANLAVSARARASGQRAMLNCGLAVHSLRAAGDAAIHTLTRDHEGPIHIHIAEQTAEVEECLRLTGHRPVQHLATLPGFDARWHLVHATHVEASEIESVARARASLIMCPTTEANLGDGLTPMPHWLAAGVPIGIGSDSHISRDWREELRWLEYGQRLRFRQRNILASATESTGTRLFREVMLGGAAQAGMRKWGLIPGARADLLVLDLAASNMRSVAQANWLDACIFSAPGQSFDRVMVGGRWRLGSSGPQFR